MDLETELLRVLDGGQEPSPESEESDEWSPMPFGRPAEPRPVEDPI